MPKKSESVKFENDERRIKLRFMISTDFYRVLYEQISETDCLQLWL